jgi:hypothetical protein
MPINSRLPNVAPRKATKLSGLQRASCTTLSVALGPSVDRVCIVDLDALFGKFRNSEAQFGSRAHWNPITATESRGGQWPVGPHHCPKTGTPTAGSGTFRGRRSWRIASLETAHAIFRRHSKSTHSIAPKTIGGQGLSAALPSWRNRQQPHRHLALKMPAVSGGRGSRVDWAWGENASIQRLQVSSTGS